MDKWNAKDYSQFLDLRTRPAQDLLSAIPSRFIPKCVYDLGCGPGNSTILLKERWPHAHIVGLDSSVDMLEQAKNKYPNLSFICGNIENFSPLEKVDCLFANASLQWLDSHELLFSTLLKGLNFGGMLAIQMPNNFHSPSHQVTIEILEKRASWRYLLKNLRYGKLTQPFYKLSFYYDLLTKLNMHSLQLWETQYFQEMESYEAIYDWVKGTGLRPILNAMNPEEQTEFSKAYITEISKAYSRQVNQKILFPFRRLFMTACKNGRAQ